MYLKNLWRDFRGKLSIAFVSVTYLCKCAHTCQPSTTLLSCQLMQLACTHLQALQLLPTQQLRVLLYKYLHSDIYWYTTMVDTIPCMSGIVTDCSMCPVLLLIFQTLLLLYDSAVHMHYSFYIKFKTVLVALHTLWQWMLTMTNLANHQSQRYKRTLHVCRKK